MCVLLWNHYDLQERLSFTLLVSLHIIVANTVPVSSYVASSVPLSFTYFLSMPTSSTTINLDCTVSASLVLVTSSRFCSLAYACRITLVLFVLLDLVLLLTILVRYTSICLF